MVGLNLGESTVIEDTVPPSTECPTFEYDFRNGYNDWTTYDVSGNSYWGIDQTYGAKLNAYYGNDGQEHWLISPALDMEEVTSATLTINHNIYYDNGTTGDYTDDQTVWVSNNYTDGMAPSLADWTQLTLSDYGLRNYVDATAEIPESLLRDSNVRIAFKYTASSHNDANYWEIKTAAIETTCAGDVPDAVENTLVDTPKARKVIYNGALYIEYNGQWFDSMGRMIRE